MVDPAVEQVMDLVVDHAPALLPGAAVDRDTRTLLVPLEDGRVRVSLDDLLSEMAGVDPLARAEAVRRWLAGTASQVAALADEPDPLEAAPTRMADLRLQVVPGWDAASLAPVVSTSVGRTFDAVVVYPGPQGRPTFLVRAVADAHLGGADACVEAALQQTIAELAPQLQVEDARLDGHLVRRLTLPGYPFVPVVLMSLDRFLPGSARGGSAVLVPSYDEVVVSSVDTRADLDVVPALSALARERHQSASMPFSADVYWYLGGTFHLVDAAPDGQVVFPAELRPAVTALA